MGLCLTVDVYIQMDQPNTDHDVPLQYIRPIRIRKTIRQRPVQSIVDIYKKEMHKHE